MSRELDCEIVRDLLPLYVEGLTSPGTSAAVEQHLAGCPACAAARETMAAPGPEPARPAQNKEVDYLKRVRARSRLRVVLAVVCTVLVLAVCAAAKAFWVGSEATREGMSWSVQTEDETGLLNLRVTSHWSGVAYRKWQVVRQGDTVTITARKVLPSPLCGTADYRTQIQLDGVREIYLCGVLLWQDGTVIFEDTLTLLAAHTPYVGDAPALGRLAGALYVADLCGGFTNELQTNAEPYGWTLHFTEPRSPSAAESLNRQMTRMAVKMLALVDNLGEVHWTYTDEDGMQHEWVYTRSQADGCAAALADADGSADAPRTVRQLTQTAAGLQRLCNALREGDMLEQYLAENGPARLAGAV